jgi:hypothetical protein
MKIGTVVLSTNGKFRSKSLNLLADFPEVAEVVVFKSLTPKFLGCTQKKHRHNRGYTCNEYATSLSHQAARNFAFTKGWDWTIFVEDDAEVSKDFNSKLLDVLTYNFSKPKHGIALHLFPEQFGLLKILTEKIYKIILLPDYAVGYVLDRQALLYCLRESNKVHFYLADWPRFIRKLDWYCYQTSLVMHPDLRSIQNSNNSDIEIGRNQRFKQYNLFQRIINSRLLTIVVLKVMKFIGNSYGNAPIQAQNFRTVSF